MTVEWEVFVYFLLLPLRRLSAFILLFLWYERLATSVGVCLLLWLTAAFELGTAYGCLAFILFFFAPSPFLFAFVCVY